MQFFQVAFVSLLAIAIAPSLVAQENNSRSSKRNQSQQIGEIQQTEEAQQAEELPLPATSGGRSANCCDVCALERTCETETRECWCVKCEKVCIPPFRFPWECRTGVLCGQVRTVAVLESHEYETKRPGCKWSVKTICCPGSHHACENCQSTTADGDHPIRVVSWQFEAPAPTAAEPAGELEPEARREATEKKNSIARLMDHLQRLFR